MRVYMFMYISLLEYVLLFTFNWRVKMHYCVQTWSDAATLVNVIGRIVSIYVCWFLKLFSLI